MSAKPNSTPIIGALVVSGMALLSCSDQSQVDDIMPESQSAAKVDTLRIAAAANLTGVLPSLIADYQDRSGLSLEGIEVTYGSSGKLYAQIQAGAPYDLYLAANQDYPARLVHESKQNLTVKSAPQQPFTYAQGQLALYSKTQSAPISSWGQSELTTAIKLQPNSKVTIANPKLAPYGASAQAYLDNQGLFGKLSQQHRLIQAENISQAFQYAHSGNVDFGLVALSQIVAAGVPAEHFSPLPAEQYPPILQDGLVIDRSSEAGRFAEYLQSSDTQRRLAQAGYIPIH